MRTLLLDVETAPRLSYHWGMWEQNIAPVQMVHNTHILCWAAKWTDERSVMTDALYLHKKEYKLDPYNDIQIMKSIWSLLNEADIVVAHNGARFDIPVLNARFVTHGMTPPSPYKLIDTLKIARSQFSFSSNKLDELGRQLDLGRKIDTGGFELWRSIVEKQDQKAFERMVKYNIQDVKLLEQVYLRLRAWDKSHPSVTHVTSDDPSCNICNTKAVKNGSFVTNTGIFQKYKCPKCGHNMRERKPEIKRSPLISI